MSFSFRFKAQADDPKIDSLWELGCQGISEEKDEIVAYFATQQSLPFEGSWQEINTDGYVEAYYASLEPVQLEHLIVAPTHSSVSVTAGQKILWLDPGMAFGTGHHETTRLILEKLEQLPLKDKAVLDVGAGSGILAIAANLLGSANVSGVDIDPLTVPVAYENADLNRANITFKIGTLDDVSESYDILLANLFAELHVQLAEDYLKTLNPTGDLLISGIMKEKCDSVLAVIKPLFTDIEVKHDGEWSFIYAKKPSEHLGN